MPPSASKALGIDWIATSLYGPPTSTTRWSGFRARTRASSKRSRSCARRASASRSSRRSAERRCPHIPYIIDTAKELDCGLVYLCDLITSGRSEGEDDLRITAQQWREFAETIVEDMLDPDVHLEYDIGALPSMIPYLAQLFSERGVDVSQGLERLKIMSACPVGKGHMNINSRAASCPASSHRTG
jgi:hypothetical protein